MYVEIQGFAVNVPETRGLTNLGKIRLLTQELKTAMSARMGSALQM